MSTRERGNADLHYLANCFIARRSKNAWYLGCFSSYAFLHVRVRKSLNRFNTTFEIRVFHGPVLFGREDCVKVTCMRSGTAAPSSLLKVVESGGSI